MSEEPVSIFISYAHEDEHERSELKKQLKNIRPSLDIWDDREINAGDQWDDRIGTSLDSADIMLMLVSTDFLNSEYVQTYEIPKAIKRQEDDDVKVVPILLKQCKWEGHGLDKNQALPSDGEWVVNQSTTTGEDFLNKKILLSVVEGIEKVAKELLDHRRQHSDKLEAYKSKVAETLSDNKISLAERDTLDDLREELGLSAEEAAAIEKGETKSIDDKRKAQAGYKRTLTAYLDKGAYPLPEEDRNDLKQRQRDLGLSDDDIAGIEDEAVEEWKTAKTQAERDAERARVELQAKERADREAREREAKERAEREANEQAEREAKEQAEREAAEQAEREAKEQAEREAAEQAEREAKEQAERQAAELAKRQAREQAVRWACELSSVLDGYGKVIGGPLAVQPKLPKQKLAAALEVCKVPEYETVIGLYSAEPTIVFGLHGIYPSGTTPNSAGPIVYSSWTDASVDQSNAIRDLALQARSNPIHMVALQQILARMVELTRTFDDHIDAIAVQAALSADELTSIRDGIVEAVTADRAVRAKDRKRWSRVLTKFLKGTRCIVKPNISAKKLGNAFERYAIPLSEDPIGLIDTTVFGSAKDGLMFGRDGIYFHNSLGKNTGTFAIPYSELPAGDLVVDSDEVLLGDVSFYFSGLPWSRDVLQGVRDLYVEDAKAAAATANDAEA